MQRLQRKALDATDLDGLGRNAKRAYKKELRRRRRERRAALEAARLVARANLGEGTTDKQPSNLAEGSATAAEGCTLWHTVIPGEVCLGVIDKSEGLTVEDFYGLNPEVSSDCSNLTVGHAYCIDTDHSDEPTAARTLTKTKSTCKAKSKTTVTSSSDTSDVTPVGTTSRNGSSSSSGDDDDTDVVPAVTPSSSGNKTSPKSSGGSVQVDQEGFRISGLINIAVNDYSSSCGSPDASPTSDERTGPNGSIDWLNCGISKSNPNSQWNAPTLKISDIVVKELTADGVFAPCAPFFDMFHAAAKKYDIPAIFIASFAMQESTCQPDAKGDNGHAYGLMQIVDKCDGAPNGNCLDPAFNIDRGTSYFRSVLDQFDGNLLHAIGQYNGWPVDMSYSHATAAAYTSCCVCQNNLDYMHQMLNLWMQGLNGQLYKPYNNLAVCGGSQAGNSKRSVAGSRLMAKYLSK